VDIVSYSGVVIKLDCPLVVVFPNDRPAQITR